MKLQKRNGNESVNSLSDIQKIVLKYIYSYLLENQSTPTYREIADAVGRDKKVVWDACCALERKGFLEILRNKTRGIRVMGAKIEIPKDPDVA